MNCPKCGSNRIRTQYPDISCMSCGYNDSLMDFPISHEHHRALCFDNNRPVPISCTASIKEKEKEKSTLIISREQTGQLQQIHGEVFYLRNKVNEHLTKTKKRDRL